MSVYEALYNVFMRRNTVYAAFVIGGALAGERMVNYGFDEMWKANNRGKLYGDLEGSVIGGEKEDDDD